MTYDLGGESSCSVRYAGVGHREPNRTDLQYAADCQCTLQAERMLDVEFNYPQLGGDIGLLM